MKYSTIALCLMIILLHACTSQRQAATGAASSSDTSLLMQAQWQLKTLGGQPVPSSMARAPFLKFSEGAVQGSAGCNSLRGAVTFPGNGQLSFGALMTTKMACEGMDTEMKFLEALRAVDHFRIMDGKLQLMKGEAVLAQLEKV